jgi:hypothetical protein
MIARDSAGFVGQIEVGHDLKPLVPQSIDHGDCAARTGILAMCGSEIDIELIPKFIKGGLLTRHPTSTVNTGTAPHNDPKSLSRDQLVGWAAGVDFTKIKSLEDAYNVQDCLYHYAKEGWVNADFLPYDVRLFLYLKSKLSIPWKIEKIGMLWLPVSIWWQCKHNSDHELNQLICVLSKFDKKYMRMMVSHHPDWKKNLRDYYCGWRNLPEMYELLVKFVEGYTA